MTAQKKKLRVLIGKLGLDGHDRGSKIIAKEEDVDIIGISLLSGAHETLLPELCQLLKENDAGDIAVVAGGIIPKGDIPVLKQAGVKAVFGPGDTTKKIIKYIKSIGTNE
ncbi:MAG: methylmalonyl-CoA mutase [Deltaproteobacteria bacterium]|nr:methylmalonyl-CoA mutase [Deltaproteobacteria bacterium]